MISGGSVQWIVGEKIVHGEQKSTARIMGGMPGLPYPHARQCGDGGDPLPTVFVAGGITAQDLRLGSKQD